MAHEHINPDRFADSAGVPWEGRHFESNQWANDDGSPDPTLQAAIDAFLAQQSHAEDVVRAFGGARLLIPLIAQLGEAGAGSHGQTVDKSADLSIVSVETPDGQVGLPVFSSVVTMRHWNPLARPVPIEAARVALAAASENNTRIVLDPASESEFVIRRPAIEAIARQVSWVHPARNSELKALIAKAIDAESAIENFAIQDGDPRCRLQGPEVLVFLKIGAGTDQGLLEKLLSRLTTAWAKEPSLALGVDSFGVKLIS